MLTVYVNYPNARVTLHADPSCEFIRATGKSGQRTVRIDPRSISDELLKFGSKHYAFASHSASNDMWLEIDFDDHEFERAVLQYVLRQLGRHYAPFSSALIQNHC